MPTIKEEDKVGYNLSEKVTKVTTTSCLFCILLQVGNFLVHTYSYLRILTFPLTVFTFLF